MEKSEFSVYAQVFKLRGLGLEVFSKKQLSSNTIVTFFWRDDVNSQGYGPFQTINAAVTHYESLQNSIHNPPSPDKPSAQIITVDFKNKRRVLG